MNEIENMENFEIKKESDLIEGFKKEESNLSKDILNKNELRKFEKFKSSLSDEIVNYFKIDYLNFYQKVAIVKMAENMNKNNFSKKTSESFLLKLKEEKLGENHLKKILNEFNESNINKLEPYNKVFKNKDSEGEELDKLEKEKQLKKILTRGVLLEFKITNPDLKVDFNQINNPIYLNNLLKAIENGEFEYKGIIWRKENNGKGNDGGGLNLKEYVKDFIKEIKENNRLAINLMNGCMPGE